MLKKEMSNLIEEIFYRMIAIRSDTNTLYEPIIEDVILNWFRQREYFQENYNHFGTEPLDNDKYGRQVVWALVKGKGDDTIVLINHHDAIGTTEYGDLEDLAFRPEDLKRAFKEKKINKKDIKLDLEDDNWIFGRGTADMKGGLALQAGVVEYFSLQEDFEGNILFLSVPDEETISKGMLKGAEFMDKLRVKYGLNYLAAINSEPYFNNVKNTSIYYEGSVGKIMPIIYVKGVKSHISDPYNGVSPSMILANIQKRTELNPGLCDVYKNDATPPPMWVHLKDRKKVYDASIPEAAVGFFNWLTFNKSPKEILVTLREYSLEAIKETLVFLDGSYKIYCGLNDREYEKIEYNPLIIDFRDAYKMAVKDSGYKFEVGYNKLLNNLKRDYLENKITLPELSVALVEYTGENINISDPLIIIGLSGPYYPHINNNNIIGEKIDFEEKLNKIANENFNFQFEKNEYFMGMCDLSYCGFTGDIMDIINIKENSPGWDDVYKIPFDSMKNLNMKVLNIGPWGKDLHKSTERVYGPDVFERIPFVIIELIKDLFS